MKRNYLLLGSSEDQTVKLHSAFISSGPFPSNYRFTEGPDGNPALQIGSGKSIGT